MEPPRQKFFARLILIVCTALGALWLGCLDYSKKISTNVIDLIPKDERSPELNLVRTFANDRQARVLLLALDSGKAGSPSEDAVKAFVEALRQSPSFEDVVPMGDTSMRDSLGKFVFIRRNDLLLPSWLAQHHREFIATGEPPENFSRWLAERVSTQLDQFLARTDSIVFQDIIPQDPLLLVSALAQKTQSLATSTPSTKGNTALVWALIKESPLDEAGQQPVFATIDAALAQARHHSPEAELRWTGVNRFAAESRRLIQAEIGRLNTLSIVAVIGITCIFVRRIWKVLHLIPVVLLATLGAWVATTLVFERVHILVFVVGSLLAGVAIDYGFYLYMQPALREGETYREKLGRLLKPLLTSSLTSIAGFSFLLFSDLPFVSQLGVYVSAGLLSALAAAILYFAQLENPFLEARNLPRPNTGRTRHIITCLGAVAVTVAIAGTLRLHWRDDVRDLDIPAKALRDNDRDVRSLFGDSSEQAVYLTRGTTPADARAALDRFLQWHDARHPQNPATSAGLLLATETDWQATPKILNQLANFESDLKAAFEQHGYTATGFEPFFVSWRELLARSAQPSYASIVNELRTHLPGPLSLLCQLAENGQNWFLSIASHPVDQEPPAEFATTSVNQLESLNTLFSRYRTNAVLLSSVGLAIIGGSVFVLYGLRRGIRIFMIPAGSCFFSLGLLGLCGQTLNIMHLLGAFLGVCLSHNYAIFSAENAGRHEPPPPSIRLSALCTAASFGVLAISTIPVIAGLGLIVTLIVMTALFMVELEPLGRIAPKR